MYPFHPQRSAEYIWVCTERGCNWCLADGLNNNWPPPAPWVYFTCSVCWQTVAQKQEGK